MSDNHELLSYLARVVGYSLTGVVNAHVLGFLFGGGANGKSTFTGTMHAMLGDYAAPAPRSLLFRSKGERHPTELASLHGRRFVTCSEIESGLAFDEALVKDLTGGDPVSCRRMRENFWSFEPTHKLFVCGNHKPVIRGDDEGIRRRIRLIPWTVEIPVAERDPMLPQKLRTELSGILAWAVRGCLEWQRDGLGDPPAVTEATKEYFEESDVAGQFFTSELAFGADGRISKKALREAYSQWCADSGFEPLGARRFAERLRSLGVRPTNVRDGVRTLDGWAGVRLMTAEERATRSWGCGVVAGSDSSMGPRGRAQKSTYTESSPHEDPTPPHDAHADFAAWLDDQGIGGGT